MSNEKPKNISDYKKWLETEHKIRPLNRITTHYESVTNKIKLDLKKSDFWKELTGSLKKYDQEYLLKTGYYLLLSGFEPELDVKPFDSFFLKTFRKNILENKRWPDGPEDGWVLPENWFFKISDVIRTLFIVKYLDGVEFINDKIESICKKYNAECKSFYEAREEGYYAAHLYTKQEFEIPKLDWDTESVAISIEIQITTQLQEVIRKLLHKYYEERRRREKREEGVKWQWDYGSDEFSANYLGHILHYVEGMIMEIREDKRR